MGRLMTVIGTLIVIIIISSVGYFAYTVIIKTGSTNQNSVRFGDTIHVDYIGQFENKKVFDTSIYDVATNNYSYPKSLSFTMRQRSEYTPFNFTVGAGTVIKGWDNGVIGMKIGDTRILNLSKDEAYGNTDPSLIKTYQLVQNIQMVNQYNKTGFKKYFGVDASLTLQLTDPTWGWNASVMSITSDIVTVRSSPFIDEMVHPYKAWSSEVITIDSSANSGLGLIQIKHLITTDMVNNVQGTDSSGSTFRLTGLSTALGTFTIDYNREVVGQTLIFTITLISIKR